MGWVTRAAELGTREGGGEVVLWMLFVGEVTGVLEDDGEEWVARRVREVVAGLGLRDWEEVREVLRKFPWVDVCYDGKGGALWERSLRLY